MIALATRRRCIYHRVLCYEDAFRLFPFLSPRVLLPIARRGSYAMSSYLETLAGPYLIFLCIALVLYGVFCAQAYYYWTTYVRESCWIRCFVFSLWILETIHSVFCVHALYSYFIIDFGDAVDGVYKIVWSASVGLLLSLYIVSMIKGFYVYRIWKLSGSVPLAGFLIFLLSGVIAISTAACSYIFKPGITWADARRLKTFVILTNLGLALGAMLDFVITSLLTYYLHRGRHDVGRTRRAIDKLMQYTIHTGATTLLVSSAILITFDALPDSLVFLGIIGAVSKVYANSVLTVLNARRDIRGQLDAEDHNSIHLSSGRIQHAQRQHPGPRIGTPETRIEIYKETIVLRDEEIIDDLSVHETSTGRVRETVKFDPIGV